MSRPTHLRASYLGLALLGGAGGTAAREAISLAVPSVNGIPVAIFVINVLGAFLLGLLLEALARRGPDEGVRRTVRILIGTGFMGGFTTYSALAADAAGLLAHGAAGAGIGYGLATVVLGGLATWAGIAVGVATHRRPGAGHDQTDAWQAPIDPDLAEATTDSPNAGTTPESGTTDTAAESRTIGAAPESGTTETAAENGGPR